MFKFEMFITVSVIGSWLQESDPLRHLPIITWIWTGQSKAHAIKYTYFSRQNPPLKHLLSPSESVHQNGVLKACSLGGNRFSH